MGLRHTKSLFFCIEKQAMRQMMLLLPGEFELGTDLLQIESDQPAESIVIQQENHIPADQEEQ